MNECFRWACVKQSSKGLLFGVPFKTWCTCRHSQFFARHYYWIWPSLRLCCYLSWNARSHSHFHVIDLYQTLMSTCTWHPHVFVFFFHFIVSQHYENSTCVTSSWHWSWCLTPLPHLAVFEGLLNELQIGGLESPFGDSKVWGPDPLRSHITSDELHLPPNRLRV